MSNAVKNFDILATLSVLIILIVQQNYFSDLYLAKNLDLSTKPFFPWSENNLIVYYQHDYVNFQAGY